MTGTGWSTTFLVIWQIGSLCILGGSFRIAQCKYPTTYSIFDHTISSQGNPEININGHYFWRIGAILVGLLRIVDFLILYLEMKSINRWGSMLGLIFGFVATLGFALVGIIPENKIKPHLIFANMAFIGYFLTANTHLIILINPSKFVNLSFLRKTLLIGCYIIFDLSFMCMIIAFFKNGGSKLKLNKQRWRGFPIWEWIYFLIIIVWSVAITYII